MKPIFLIPLIAFGAFCTYAIFKHNAACEKLGGTFIKTGGGYECVKMERVK